MTGGEGILNGKNESDVRTIYNIDIGAERS
jgi:hypothetical protein